MKKRKKSSCLRLKRVFLLEGILTSDLHTTSHPHVICLVFLRQLSLVQRRDSKSDFERMKIPSVLLIPRQEDCYRSTVKRKDSHCPVCPLVLLIVITLMESTHLRVLQWVHLWIRIMSKAHDFHPSFNFSETLLVESTAIFLFKRKWQDLL